MAASRSVCPKCCRTYAATVRVCEADGAELLDEEPAARPKAAASLLDASGPAGEGPAIDGAFDDNEEQIEPVGLPPEKLGPYRLIRLLGEGGMARVYLAEHEKLGRVCAIKRLHSDHFADTLTVARFLAEARAVGAVHHPNLVEAYDVVETPNDIYLVMEYLDGRDVSQVLRDEGPIQPERAAEIVAQACDGLTAVHARNIVHRDLKPENIFITRLPEGIERVKLLDFGVARLLGDRPPELKTRSGLTVGTPTYMSPEQATASEIDVRSDIYTAGVVLFEMMTGVPPFNGAGYGDVMLMHVNDPPPALSSRLPGAPAWMESIVARCLEKEPADRFQSAAELAAALRAGVHQASVAPASASMRRAAPRRTLGGRRAWWLAGAVGIVGLVAVAVVLAWPRSQRPQRTPSVQTPVAFAPTPAAPLPAAPPPPRKPVHVASVPPGATVLTYGVERCKTPCDLDLRDAVDAVVGITLEAPGYVDEQRKVELAALPAELRVTMRSAVPPPPRPSPDRPKKPRNRQSSTQSSRNSTLNPFK